jgi:hypothetical protein
MPLSAAVSYLVAILIRVPHPKSRARSPATLARSLWHRGPGLLRLSRPTIPRPFEESLYKPIAGERYMRARSVSSQSLNGQLLRIGSAPPARYIEVRNLGAFFSPRALGSVPPRLTRAGPALVSTEGDKTVISSSQSFNVLSLGSEYDKELQNIFCPPFRWPVSEWFTTVTPCPRNRWQVLPVPNPSTGFRPGRGALADKILK